MDICHIKIITEFIVAQKKTFVSTFCEKNYSVYKKAIKEAVQGYKKRTADGCPLKSHMERARGIEPPS